jgi:hypothetical protein
LNEGSGIALPDWRGGTPCHGKERHHEKQRFEAFAAGSLALLVCASSLAQTQSQVQPQTTETPAPIVIQTTVNLASGGPQSPQSALDARKEAVAALAEAKTACRREASRQAQNDCLRQAQDDYNAVMGRISHPRQ